MHSEPQRQIEMSDQLHSPATLPPSRRNSPRYSFNGKLGGPHGWCGRYGEEKNLFPPAGTETRFLDYRVRSLIGNNLLPY
jgi:hypothetical protein